MLNLDIYTIKTIGSSFEESFYRKATYCESDKVNKYIFLFKKFVERTSFN